LGAAGVGVSCGQTKWEKAQGIIADIKLQLQNSELLPHKDLEQKRFFLVQTKEHTPVSHPFLKAYT
jgi:hypothetical protein